MPPDDKVIDGDGEAPVIVLEGAPAAATAGEGIGPLGGCCMALGSSGI